MKLLFWVSLLFIVLTYAAYPFWLYFRAKLRPRPVRRQNIFPYVTIMLAVRNEQNKLRAKLQNLVALNYPADRLEIIVVSDGSTDDTNRILDDWADRCRLMILPQHQGKASALNKGVSQANGEIIVFTDARQIIDQDALTNLVANFADPSVGCASGELMIAAGSAVSSVQGVGLYWQVEKKIRQWEALSGSTVGATGAFYAVRRNLVVPLPEGTILDDVYIPLQVVQKGFRVVFEPLAVATDDLSPSPLREFRRKVRTLTGNYQLLRLSPWLLTRSNPLRFEFVCHKLLRLVVPFALVCLLFASVLLREGPYRVALASEITVAGLAVVAVLRPRLGPVSRLADVCLAFLVLNAAAALAFLYFVSGKKQLWA